MNVGHAGTTEQHDDYNAGFTFVGRHPHSDSEIAQAPTHLLGNEEFLGGFLETEPEPSGPFEVSAGVHRGP